MSIKLIIKHIKDHPIMIYKKTQKIIITIITILIIIKINQF